MTRATDICDGAPNSHLYLHGMNSGHASGAWEYRVRSSKLVLAAEFMVVSLAALAPHKICARRRKIENIMGESIAKAGTGKSFAA